MSGLVDKLASQRTRASLRTPEPGPRGGKLLLDRGEAATAPALGEPTPSDPALRALNRFAAPQPEALVARLADLYGVLAPCVAVTADVADAGEALVRVFRRPGRDEPVVLAGRGFEAAALAAELHGCKVYDVGARAPGAFDLERVASTIKDAGGAALVLLASPSYETGELVSPDAIRTLVARFPESMFVVDESFIELADAPSLAAEAAEAEGLVVLRSLSRAYGLAGAGVGAAVASGRIVQLVSAALAHRPVATPSVALAISALSPLRASLQPRRLAETVAERARVAAALAGSPFVAEIKPSRANFLALRAKDRGALQRRLGERGIAVDWASEPDEAWLRLTIGTSSENNLVLAAFDAPAPARRSRTAEAARETKETRIAVRVDLDGAPRAEIATGVGYFDHMLEQVAKHAGFELTLVCEGDTQVDAHHTIEDCMLALGGCLREALGDKRGIARFGFTLPMDEAEAEALIDLSGRPFAVFEGAFTASHIGDYPTEMTAHAFRSLAETLGAAIHVKVQGENDHHKTEACFKAFGRALRQAIRIEGEDLPSTKGVL
jgi:histidinol-phosphate aminotransferase/imidazoleglycerol-phosphate dehydratase/histidinol-phosphatase